MISFCNTSLRWIFLVAISMVSWSLKTWLISLNCGRCVTNSYICTWRVVILPGFDPMCAILWVVEFCLLLLLRSGLPFVTSRHSGLPCVFFCCTVDDGPLVSTHLFNIILQLIISIGYELLCGHMISLCVWVGCCWILVTFSAEIYGWLSLVSCWILFGESVFVHVFVINWSLFSAFVCLHLTQMCK